MCDLFVGRFQPITKTHFEMISSLQDPVVCIVRGQKSSLDKQRNPFSLEYQMECLNKLFGDTVRVVVSSSGYLPEVVSSLNEVGICVRSVHCGSDRYMDYRSQLERHTRTTGVSFSFDLVEHSRTDDVSGTVLRESLRNGDRSRFLQLIPSELQQEYEYMKGIIETEGPTNNIGSGEVSPHPKPMGFPLLSRRRMFQDYHKKLESKTKPKYNKDVEDEESRKI